MGQENRFKQEEILRLVSLREVFGGFAHEIAQPLNAIMIASQVIQLKLDRSFLSEEEKYFLSQRLQIVSSQVQRASEVIENLRTFSRSGGSPTAGCCLKSAFERIHGLMGQQLAGRGIDLHCDSQIDHSLTIARFHFTEGVIVQGLAFSRDCVMNIHKWHEEHNLPYNKAITVRLLQGPSQVNIYWNLGNLPENVGVISNESHAGLQAAVNVIETAGGSLIADRTGLKIAFPT